LTKTGKYSTVFGKGNIDLLRRDGRLHEITGAIMRGIPTRGRRRIQELHDLANDDLFVALKRATKPSSFEYLYSP